MKSNWQIAEDMFAVNSIVEYIETGEKFKVIRNDCCMAILKSADNTRTRLVDWMWPAGSFDERVLKTWKKS